ncbi:MAG: hypothetical protein ACLTZJ_06730 [Oscillospiraceae bacterium]
MKRLIAFALALAVVFGVSFALYKPERIEAAAQETMDDEWVGYFFALEPFDGRRYATENGDDYDFGVPGVPVFVTITAFEPDDPDYEEGSEFNNSVGAAVSDEVVGSGMHIKVDDNGSSYETGGEIALDALGQAELYECYVYRTSAGDYYAECTQANGTNVRYRTPSANLNQTRTISTERSSDWRVNGKAQSRSIKVSVSFVAYTAAESVEFVWMDSDKNVLSRAEYAADALPETLAAPEHAALLVTAMQSVDGTTERTLCTQDDLFSRAYVPSTLSGLLRVVDVSLDWGEDET